MVRGIHHFSIIESSEESVRFYKAWGFIEKSRIERSSDYVVLLEGFDVGLELFIDPKHPQKSKVEPLGLRSLSLLVDNLEKSVIELNIEDWIANNDWIGERYCNITDLDGNVVQLHE